MCLLAYFLPVGQKPATDPFSAQVFLGFLGTLIPCTSWNTHCSLCLTKLSYNGMSSNPISLIATVLCITMHNILLQYETLLQVQKWGYKHCIACVDSQLTYTCIFSLWQQAYIKGAKWYRGETAAGQWTPIKWLWTQWPEELLKQLVCKFSLYLL